jgi:hypothetical protein
MKRTLNYSFMQAQRRWGTRYCLIWAVFVTLFIQCAQDNVLTDGDDTLTIDSISPTGGVPGSQLRIYGKGFSVAPEINTVLINELEVSVEASSVGTILVTVPLQATTGPVSVKSGEQTAVGPVFTITPPPAINTLEPDNGFAGDQTTIRGTGFDQVQEVFFNGTLAVISSRTDVEMHVVVPQSTTGSVVLNYNGGVISGPVFTYGSIPLIESIELTFGRPRYLHITGRHFGQDPSALKVYMDGVEVPILEQLLVPEPAHLAIATPDPAGDNPIDIVVESDGHQSLPFEFTMTPNLFTFNFSATSTSGNNVTYDFQIEGEYFGNAGANRSVQFRHTGTGAITTATIGTWAPNYITGQFTFDPTTLGNDALAVSVVVNGVHSPEQEFRP